MKTNARMNTFKVVAAVLLFTSCAIHPQAVRIYKPTSMQPAQPRQERENLTWANIYEIIRRGDAAFAKQDYATAKELYYTALLTAPDSDADVLVSYGNCLANLERYQDAITVFNIALNKDRYNETANNGIAICRENIAAQERQARQRQAEYERQQREQEERRRQQTAAILDATLNLAIGAAQIASTYYGGSSGYSGGGSGSSDNTGNSGSSGSSSGSSSSSDRVDCSTCKANPGKCNSCKGTGKLIYKDTGRYIGTNEDTLGDCAVCKGSGNCGVCYGKGYIRL